MIRKWNELTEEIQAPDAVLAALSTNRPQLLKFGPYRTSTAEQTKQLYNVIRVLMETNSELQKHSQQLADEANQLRSSFKGISRKLNELHATANFSDAMDEEESWQAEQ